MLTMAPDRVPEHVTTTDLARSDRDDTVAMLRRHLPAPPPRETVPLVPVPGQVVGLHGPAGMGLTRLGLSMAAGAAIEGSVACVDVRGWLCPSAAWEVGIDPDRLVVVRCDDPVTWARVVAGLLDGMGAVYAEVPRQVKEAPLRILASAVRSKGTPLVLNPLSGMLPGGLAQLRLEGRRISWEGTGVGHGRLLRRRLVLEASGKAVKGMTRIIEVEDHGADALRVVSRLGTAPARYAAG